MNDFYQNELKELNRIEDFIKSLNLIKKKRVLVPVVDGLAYFEGDIINTNDCMINIGCEYFIETVNSKALSFLDRLKEKLIEQAKLSSKDEDKIKLEPEEKATIEKMDDDTFEIKEVYQENEMKYEVESKPLSKISAQKCIMIKQKLQEPLSEDDLLNFENLFKKGKTKEIIHSEVEVIESNKANTKTSKKKDTIKISDDKTSSAKELKVEENKTKSLFCEDIDEEIDI